MTKNVGSIDRIIRAVLGIALIAWALTGTGLPPRCLGEINGIFKAYCTRVGNGPFPTELEDATGERMRERGAEYGTTTGRPRRWAGEMSSPFPPTRSTASGATS
mgnify:CR=1 FL=1